MARTGRLKKICNHACRVAGALQKTPPSEILEGQGADFLRGVAIWSIMTGAALRTTWHQFLWQAQYFTQMGWKNHKTHWYEAVSSALNFPFLKESRWMLSFFHFQVQNWGSLAELLRFGPQNFYVLRKSHRIASFWTCQLPLWKKALHNSFLSDRKIDRWIERFIDS